MRWKNKTGFGVYVYYDRSESDLSNYTNEELKETAEINAINLKVIDEELELMKTIIQAEEKGTSQKPKTTNTATSKGEFVGFIVGARAGGWDVDFLFWMENQACCVFHFDVSMVKHEEHTSCLVQ